MVIHQASKQDFLTLTGLCVEYENKNKKINSKKKKINYDKKDQHDTNHHGCFLNMLKNKLATSSSLAISDSEQSSWFDSIKIMRRILKNEQSNVNANIQVMMEYKVPNENPSLRIDFILCGYDQDRFKILLIEMKQWNVVKTIGNKVDDKFWVSIESKSGKNFIKKHPARQVLIYKNLLNSLTKDVPNIEIDTMVFMNKYKRPRSDENIFDPIYKEFLDQTNFFFRDEEQEVVKFINSFIPNDYHGDKFQKLNDDWDKLISSQNEVDQNANKIKQNELFTFIRRENIFNNSSLFGEDILIVQIDDYEVDTLNVVESYLIKIPTKNISSWDLTNTGFYYRVDEKYLKTASIIKINIPDNSIQALLLSDNDLKVKTISREEINRIFKVQNKATKKVLTK